MAGDARGTIFRCSGALYGRTRGREGLELFRGGNLVGASSSWASFVTPPPLRKSFPTALASLDGAIRFWGDRHTVESYVNSSRSLSTNPLLRHSCHQSFRRTRE